MTANVTETFLFKKLRLLYPKHEYALMPQVGNATGASVSRHADAIMMGLWPSRGLHLHGFEIKCSYSDWSRERDHPEKAESIAKFCHYWWLVAKDDKSIPVEEVPNNWGLYVLDKEQEHLIKQKQAIFQEHSQALTWPFLAAILRQAQEWVGTAADAKEIHDAAFKEGYDTGIKTANYALEDLKELNKKVHTFTEKSGVDILTWHGPERIGSAVNAVLNGAVESSRQHLITVAQRILTDLNVDLPEPMKPRKAKK